MPDPADPADPGDPAAPGADRCRCGHVRALHRHYRTGSDCAACGPSTCARYRAAAGPWRRLARRLRAGRAG